MLVTTMTQIIALIAVVCESIPIVMILPMEFTQWS